MKKDALLTVIRVAYFGDVVGASGRVAFDHAASVARSDFGADVVIVNGENAKHGRGLHPVGFDELRASGADAITLGDHYDDDPRILPYLKDPNEPVCSPVNIIPGATGYKRGVRVAGDSWSVWAIVVHGRLFMKRDATCPFDAVDETVSAIEREDPDAMVFVEIHAEATSEKGGIAWHSALRWPGRVVGVFGSHTHVQTNDPRILEDGCAALTDLGMCGASKGIIGFDAERSVASLRGTRGGLRISEKEPVATGTLVTLDVPSRRAVAIEVLRIEVPASDDSGGGH